MADRSATGSTNTGETGSGTAADTGTVRETGSGTEADTGAESPWGTLLGAWVLSVVANAYLIVPASVLPPIAADLGVTPGTAVWIVSIAFAAWAASNFALGGAISRFGDVAVLAVASLSVAIAGVWGWRAGLGGSFLSLAGSRVLGGIALGAIWTTGANVVGRVFPVDRQGIALGLFTTSAPTGLAIGQFTGPLVAGFVGWEADFLLFGFATLGGFGLFLAFAPDLRVDSESPTDTETETQTETGTKGEPDDATPAATSAIRTVLTDRSVRYGCGMGFVAYSLFLFFNSWMPTYLTEQFGVSLAASSAFVALFPAVGIVSRAGGGVVSDRLLDHRRLPVMKVSFLAAAPLVAVVAVSRTVPVVVAVLVAAGFAIQLSIGIVYTYVREVVAADASASALAVLGSAAIFGSFSAPVIAGALIEWTDAYTSAFAYAGLLALVGIALAFAAPESNP